MVDQAAAIQAGKVSIEKALTEIVAAMKIELRTLTIHNYGTKKIKLKALVDLYLQRLELQKKSFERWYGKQSKVYLDTLAEIDRWGRFRNVNIEKLSASNVDEFKVTISRLLEEIENTLKFELRTLKAAEREQPRS